MSNAVLRFGRVEGMLEWVAADDGRQLRLTVFLETSAEYRVVRKEIVQPILLEGNSIDLYWLADQYTQETIGVDLAAEGWEVIGAGDPPTLEPGEIPRSATYAVRLL